MTTLEYRLRIRNRADSGNLLTLSSRASDPNPLLTEPPQADGQRIDWARATQEIGVVVWKAADRDDGDDSRTITALMADDFARNQMLSNVCVGEYSRDGGAWTEFHTGFLNSIELADAITFAFTVGDTDRREQQAELFKFLTPTFNRGSYLIGGPIPARTPVVHGSTPADSFAGLKDYGPVRMRKVAATAGNLTIALELVSGYVRPYFARSLTTIGADEVETINRLARPWAVSALGTGRYSASGGARRAWMDFPGLIARLTPVAGGSTREVMPVGVPTTSYTGDTDRLVVGENMGLYLYWPAPLVVPTNGTLFDVIVFPNEISENAPLHWAGNPIDLATQAWDQEGIRYSASAAATVRAALASLWVEYLFTGPIALTKLVADYCCAPWGVALRVNRSGEQEMFLTREAAPASVDTVTATVIVTDE